MRKKIIGLIAMIFTWLIPTGNGQDQIRIEENGIMRWAVDGKEVTGFGVNYTVPFAHAYRSGKRLGVDLKAAIDQDVYHFVRLGLDLYRVHVWDCEISDTLGNLLDNEHLELFDYLLFKLKENGIQAVLTPIAFWGNGWPERDEPTPGFSTKYGKDSCLVDPNARIAQTNYLAQFVNHVNRYTQVAYKDEPSVLAFEISNEPHHRGTPAQVTAFVKDMRDAIRSTGCTKPIFYNVSHSIHLAEAYYEAGIDGGTFQWYPTGLGFQKELGGNMLPNVDRYHIPFDTVLEKYSSARFVYEFDAADMATSYMYPAMARSFRSAGIQLATHFSYDPTFLAPYNTEYNTHYMNLLYAPRKALALMICGEIFRDMPLYMDYGFYPANSSFGPFRVNYEKNLAEMVTNQKFIYTNHTSTLPPSPEMLELIAGWGHSPLIEYDGTGAYFLDKVGEDIWRLEIFPDAIQVDNLFGRNSQDKIVAVIQEKRHTMRIKLPGFDQGFSIESVDWRDSIVYRETRGAVADLKPGIYLLMNRQYRDVDSLLLQSVKDFDWDPWVTTLPVVAHATPYISSRNPVNEQPDLSISLFEASRDYYWLNRQWRRGSQLLDTLNTSFLFLHLDGLTRRDPENLQAPMIGDYSMRHYVGDLIHGQQQELKQKKRIVFNGFNAGPDPYPIQIALVMKDGSAFGGSVMLEPHHNSGRYTIAIDALQKVKPVLLPRPYPTFLPYYSQAGEARELDMSEIESVQISIGPGIAEADWDKPYTLFLSGISLE